MRLPQSPPPRAAVVLAHGFLGSGERGFMPWVAVQLVRAGFAVVSPTTTGSGVGPTGEHTELEALESSTHGREMDELAGVLEETRTGELTGGRPPRRVGVLGHGRGGAHALLLAARGAPVDALVTWAAPSRLDRWTGETRRAWREQGRVYVPAPGSGRQLPLGRALMDEVREAGERLDPLAAAAAVGVPWLLVHGTDDVVVEAAEARALAGAGPASRLVLVDGGDHPFGASHPFRGPSPALRAALVPTIEHLRMHLEP